MNKRNIVSVATVCSLVMVTLCNPARCFSQEGKETGINDTARKVKKDSPSNHIDMPHEQYKQGLHYAQYGLFDEAIEMFK
ncbi:MAG: hypothetical protein HUU09_11715, partial [Candidatus Jettenia caeni]|nr:hypothetical protein [Candidatus Jettenia caeni]